MRCNFCSYANLKQVYKPSGSKISLIIFICQNCGLVQSSSKKHNQRKMKPVTIEKAIIRKLSCDADYSDIRVGKEQMTNSSIEMIDKSLKHEKIRAVLDICSARGHFAKKALDHLKLDTIDCIDPDKYMTISYANDPQINLMIGKYDVLKSNKKYDLIYSCHTLEHYRDPAKKINFMIDHIRPGGYLLLNVPNLETIDNKYNLDEFFYDYHKYYFSAGILKSFITSLGMKLIAQNADSYSIEFLMEKIDEKKPFRIDRSYVNLNNKLIRAYSVNLAKNRSKLPKVASQMQKMAKNKINAIFGCGRILDALIVYGGLKINNFDILIDNFLINAATELYGKKLYRSSVLDKKKVDNIFLMTRSSTGSLFAELSKKYPKANIVHINDLLDSVV